MRCQSAFINTFTLIFLLLLTSNGLLPDNATANLPEKENSTKEKKYLFREQIVVTAVLSAGTFTMPGRNISLGLRWQK